MPVDNCPDCRGTGTIILLYSRVDCERCTHAVEASAAVIAVDLEVQEPISGNHTALRPGKFENIDRARLRDEIARGAARTLAENVNALVPGGLRECQLEALREAIARDCDMPRRYLFGDSAILSDAEVEVDATVTLGPPKFETELEQAVHDGVQRAIQEGHLTSEWMHSNAMGALLRIPGVDGVSYWPESKRIEVDAHIDGEIKAIVCQVSF